jgi:hypothetical protein
MRSRWWITAFVVVLAFGGRAPGLEPEPARTTWLERIPPAGGWFPYGGGLLHWWDPHCFPCCGKPDDYCPKPLPQVCWPPYPPYYSWGPPEICCPRTGACQPDGPRP